MRLRKTGGAWGFTGRAVVATCVILSATMAMTEEGGRYEFLQIRMGVPFRIVVYAPSEMTANLAAEAAYARVRELDRIMSDYDPDSELMQLSRLAKVGEPFPVCEDLVTVLAAARQVSEQSDGAFDVTVGPVVKLWRVARRRKRLPDPEELKSALSRVGNDAWTLDADDRTVTLHRAEMRFDLGGIAKGLAADEALAILKAHGLNQALVDASGDITVSDPPPGRDFWRIEIEEPGPSEVKQVLQLRNAAVCTSGDAYQSVEIDGTRYSHIVDPRTGIGLTVPGSVTVIAPTGMQADALASAVSVLGPVRGIELVETLPATETSIVQRTGQGEPERWSSSGWPEQSPGEQTHTAH